MIRFLVSALTLLAPLCASAQGISWNLEKIRWAGNGCQFADGPNRAQDAWVVIAGEEVSIVYSNLGGEFVNRRNSDQRSGCNLAIPIEIPRDQYVGSISQKFSYGVAKQKGVSASILAQTNFLRLRSANPRDPQSGDMQMGVAQAYLQFPADREMNIASEEATIAPIHVRRDNNPAGPFMRFCNLRTETSMLYQSTIMVEVKRRQGDAQISIAVDGQDLKFSSEYQILPCPRVWPRPGR